jgi:hypothetical protein
MKLPSCQNVKSILCKHIFSVRLFNNATVSESVSFWIL